MSRLVAMCLVALAVDPADAQPARVDLAGDPLPPGAVARIGTTRYRVRDWRQQAFLSPDGQTVLASGENGVLKLIEADTGRTVGEIKDTDLFNWTADQSPDGRFLILLGRTTFDNPPSRLALRLYDLGTRKPVWTTFPADADRADGTAVRFTPDGKRIVTAGPDVRIWDAKTGDELLRQKVPVGYGNLDVSRDGKLIAVGYREVHIWDWESGAAPRKLDAGLRTSADGIRFSPDGRTLYLFATGAYGWALDVATGKPAGRLELGPYGRQVTFSPDGTRYATEQARTYESSYWVGIRDAATAAEVMRLSSGHEPAGGGSWSRDGSRYAAAGSGRVWVWDTKTGKPLGPVVPGHGANITDLAFCSDGRLFTASDDHTVRAWDPATGNELLSLAMKGWARGMAVSPDGSLVAGNALRNDLRVWDARTGKEMFKLLGHGAMGGLRRARFTADDQRLVTFGDDFYLRVWDTLTGKLKAEHRFLPNRPFAGTGDDEDDDHQRLLGFLNYRQVELGPHGPTFVLASGKDVRVIDAETGKERFKLEADAGGVQQLALSADGKRLVTAGPGVAPRPQKVGQVPERPKDYQVAVWDMTEAKPVVQFRVPGSMFAGVLAFTPDGQRVVTEAGENTLGLWDATTGKAVGTISLPGRAAHVAFDGAGKQLAVAFWDSTALVYDLAAVLKPAK